MMKENWVYCRGDIYCANLDPVVGSEQGGIRPVIVIQNDTGNKHAPTLIVATVTTRIHKKANMPTHFVIYDIRFCRIFRILDLPRRPDHFPLRVFCVFRLFRIFL